MSMEGLKELREELELELKDNILTWWMTYVPDVEFGGFHGQIDHQNQVVKGAGKGSVLNARILWTFSAAYRMYEQPEYLETARRAYAYIISYFADKKYGGVYWELESNGLVRSSRKQIYAIAFTIYGLVEYHLASGDEQPLQYAIGLYRDIEAHAFDSVHNGYTEALTREWEAVEDLRLSEKDDNESKTMNTHLHILEAYGNLFRVWKDPELEQALENLIRLFLEKFVDPERKQLNLFFDDRWKLKSSLVSYGHDIECSWLLYEAAEILGKKELVKQTAALAIDMARANINGLDQDGGLFYEFFPETLELDADKHWWPQAEAMLGYFNAWQESGQKIFLEKALGSWEFIKAFLVDKDKGEWFWSVNRERLPQTEKEKAGFWKCPYHNGRSCLELIRRIKEIESKLD